MLYSNKTTLEFVFWFLNKLITYYPRPVPLTPLFETKEREQYTLKPKDEQQLQNEGLKFKLLSRDHMK